MIRVRLRIGDSEVYDTQEFPLAGDEKLGFVYLDSDNRIAPETKGFEATSYPEEEGEHIIPKTVDDAFDYKVKFFIQSPGIDSANAVITSFNELLFDQSGAGGVKTYKQVEFYNDYKRHKIVGYPSPISLAESFWRDPQGVVQDVVVVEWTIRVIKPSLCDFNL